MVRSTFGRFVYGALGVLALALPFLVASDRSESFDGGYAGLLAVLAPMAVALLTYALPRPPQPGDPLAAQRATMTVEGTPIAGTSIPLSRGRRIARLVMRAGWVVCLGLLTLSVALDPDDSGVAVLPAVGTLLVLPGLVSAVRGLLDPTRMGLFLAPEGVAVRGARHFVPWSQLDRADTFVFSYRGVTSVGLMLWPTTRRRAHRGPEPALPACAEDLAELVEWLRRHEDDRAPLRDGRLPSKWPSTGVLGLT